MAIGRHGRTTETRLSLCSGGPCVKKNVLFVGSERQDEFASATQLIDTGHRVLVVNPRETAPARAFRHREGRFIRLPVQRLPRALALFDTIVENYPYPIRQCCRSARRFALARLERLAPGGRWIVMTESPRFTSALKRISERDPDIASRFRLKVYVLSPEEAPPSVYPAVDTRFRLIFRRVR